INAFIRSVLAYEPGKIVNDCGILGHVSAYYGCVEAQGRGTLHCHMLIWIEGGLNPDEIKRRVLADDGDLFRKRLIQFLDDTISSAVIPNPDSDVDVQSSSFHPCSVRGPSVPNESDEVTQCMLQKDRHFLSKSCQTHKHTATCYKYWRGPPEPRTCRFELDQCNTNPFTFFDNETGEIHIRKLDGLVNDFNETILAAVRCNMDIKFIGSGASAKAVMYYITDYITKSQLKAHVAYAALELAVKRLEPDVANEDEFTVRAKRLLQRCAYSMINEQELSAQQVASYLLDFGDHFKSHSFNNLYWRPFERHVHSLDPSPECEMVVDSRNVNTDASNIPIAESMMNDCYEDEEITVSVRSDKVVSEIPGQLSDYVFR
ncbi:hypothetical protein EV361DRAFT_783237, partial [Lentinula raphanica]